MAVVRKPLAVASFTAKCGAPRVEIGSFLVSSMHRRPDDPAAAQEFMAERMVATMRRVAASHAVFMAHPGEVADIIGLAAASAKNRFNATVRPKQPAIFLSRAARAVTAMIEKAARSAE